MWCHSASAYEKSTLLYFYTPIHPTDLTPSTLVVITESPNTLSSLGKDFLCVLPLLPESLFLRIILKYERLYYALERNAANNVQVFLQLPI
jgi:hypothetical protein